MSNPFIQVVPTLTPKEVQKVNEFFDNCGIERQGNTVFSAKGFREDASYRSSAGFTLKDEHEITEIIHEGMNKALVKYCKQLQEVHPSLAKCTVPGAAGTTSYREGIQVLEYREDQEYKYHCDVNWDRKEGTFYRNTSVVLYLNAGFEGGGTEFYDAVYKPSPGDALIFPSHWSFPHCGQRVTRGMKRVAVTWYYVNPA